MIQSISVNGEVHQIDYTTLANKPTIPAIPTVTSADQGKVLTVSSSGEWQPESLDIPESVGPLPTVTSADQGKVLAVDSNGEWQPESLDIPEAVDPLPSVTSADQGKALTVTLDGTWGFNNKLTDSYITGLYNSMQLIHLRLLPDAYESDRILISDGSSWSVSDFSIIELRESVLSLASQLNSLQERVSSLASSLSDTEAYAANETLTLSGAGVSVTGEKLAINDSAANVTGEKLSI